MYLQTGDISVRQAVGPRGRQAGRDDSADPAVRPVPHASLRSPCAGHTAT